MTGQTAYAFAFEQIEADDQLFRSRGVRRLSSLIDKRISTGIPLVVYLILMGGLLLASVKGLLPISVVVVAIVSFLSGLLAIRFASSLALRRAYHSHFHQATASSRRWNVSFDDHLIVVKAGLIETRLPWAAVAQVEEAGSIMIFWFRVSAAFFIPLRAFASDLERANFAAWAAAQVKAAA